jgi:protein-S-isoprenylcysteine O-methyltransferase Ste14
MDKLVLIIGLLVYLTKSVVIVRGHFASATMPREIRFGIGASYVALAAFIYLMLRDKHATGALVAALATFAASLGLFLWAAKTTRSRQFKFAFDTSSPGPVVRTGPYRTIRHPFYASYILFWLGCVVATLHPLMLVFLILFSAMNVTAARREERSFETSPFAEEYLNFRKTAGMLWPKLAGTSARRPDDDPTTDAWLRGAHRPTISWTGCEHAILQVYCPTCQTAGAAGSHRLLCMGLFSNFGSRPRKRAADRDETGLNGCRIGNSPLPWERSARSAG